MHMGRSFVGTRLEDQCPCPKEACGLVDMNKASPECDQHTIGSCKTMRQGHHEEDCVAPPSPTLT